MKLGYNTRNEALQDLINKISKAKSFVIKNKLDYSKLGKLYNTTKNEYNKIQSKSKAYTEKEDKLCDIIDNIIIAVDLCKMRCEDSTDFFKDLEVNENLVNSFIDYQINLEKRHNSLVEEYSFHKEAFKSYKWNKVIEDDKKNCYDWLK